MLIRKERNFTTLLRQIDATFWSWLASPTCCAFAVKEKSGSTAKLPVHQVVHRALVFQFFLRRFSSVSLSPLLTGLIAHSFYTGEVHKLTTHRSEGKGLWWEPASWAVSSQSKKTYWRREQSRLWHKLLWCEMPGLCHSLSCFHGKARKGLLTILLLRHIQGAIWYIPIVSTDCSDMWQSLPSSAPQPKPRENQYLDLCLECTASSLTFDIWLESFREILMRLLATKQSKSTHNAAPQMQGQGHHTHVWIAAPGECHCSCHCHWNLSVAEVAAQGFPTWNASWPEP